MGKVITMPGMHVREGNRPGLCAKGERTIKRPATQPIPFVRSGYADTAAANNQAGTVDLSSSMRKPTQLIVASTTPMRERAKDRQRRTLEETLLLGHYLTLVGP